MGSNIVHRMHKDEMMKPILKYFLLLQTEEKSQNDRKKDFLTRKFVQCQQAEICDRVIVSSDSIPLHTEGKHGEHAHAFSQICHLLSDLSSLIKRTVLLPQDCFLLVK